MGHYASEMDATAGELRLCTDCGAIVRTYGSGPVHLPAGCIRHLRDRIQQLEQLLKKEKKR